MHWSISSVHKEAISTREENEKFLYCQVRPDIYIFNKCCNVIDKEVKLIHRRPKYSVNQVVKVYVNIKYCKYRLTQTEITT